MRTPKATAFGSFGYGWQQLWKYFLHLFLIGVIVLDRQYPGVGPTIGGETWIISITAGFVVLNMLERRSTGCRLRSSTCDFWCTYGSCATNGPT